MTSLPPAVFSWPDPATVFPIAFAALSAGHWVADYWIQTHYQATHKGLPGWAGRRACLAHVATYTLTLAAILSLTGTLLAVPLNWPHVAAGLTVSAVTHYAADRRALLRRIAVLIGKADYWDNGGAASLDQAFHWFFLFVAALLIAA